MNGRSMKMRALWLGLAVVAGAVLQGCQAGDAESDGDEESYSEASHTQAHAPGGRAEAAKVVEEEATPEIVAERAPTPGAEQEEEKEMVVDLGVEHPEIQKETIPGHRTKVDRCDPGPNPW